MRAVAATIVALCCEVSPFSDLHADEEYRRHVAGVLVSRVLAEAAA